MIIDASGKTSQFVKPFIRYTRATHVDLAYCSMEFEMPEQDLDVGGFYILPSEKCKSGCAILRLDKTTLLAAATGHAEGKPDHIKTSQDLLEFIRRLECPDPYSFLSKAKPLWEKPKLFGYKTMQHHTLGHVPNGIIFVGDTICSIDPILGQGMSKAAIEALSIRMAFEEYGFAYQKDLSNVALSAFLLSCIADYRLKHTSGYAPPSLWFLSPALNLVLRAAAQDTTVYDHFVQVMNLQLHPLSLLRDIPRILCGELSSSVTKTQPLLISDSEE